MFLLLVVRSTVRHTSGEYVLVGVRRDERRPSIEASGSAGAVALIDVPDATTEDRP